MALTPKLVERAYLGDQIVYPPDSWPLTRPGCLAWWRSDLEGSVTTVGGKVSEWKDMVSGRIMAQSNDSLRPLYDLEGFDGTPGVDFTFGQFLELASSPWPIDKNASMMIVVCDQREPVSNTDLQVLASYGDTATQQRKATRSVREGFNRGGLELGNSWTVDLFEQSRTEFFGIHSLNAVFGDVNSTAGLDDDVFSGTSSLALRTAAGRTRIGADSADASPTQFCNAIIRDVLILDFAFFDGPTEFQRFADWANSRRVPW